MTGIMHATIYPSQPGIGGSFSALDTPNVVIRDILVANGWDGITPITATYTVNAGVTIYSNSVGLPALTDGAAFPAGSLITIVILGTVLGKGGTGGITDAHNLHGGAGNPGGTALKINSAAGIVSINNTSIIGGGGGGGGAGASGFRFFSDGGLANAYSDGGGCGGGGIGNGVHGGYIPHAPNPFGPSIVNTGLNHGVDGTLTAPGAGGAPFGIGAGGGGGGNFGAAGGNGGNTSYVDPTYFIPQTFTKFGGVGGAGGKAVEGNANITWIATGTRYGAIT